MLLGERAVLHVPSQLAYGKGNGLVPPSTDVDIDVEELLMQYPDLCFSPSSGTKGYVCIHLQDQHVKETHVPLENFFHKFGRF